MHYNGTAETISHLFLITQCTFGLRGHFAIAVQVGFLVIFPHFLAILVVKYEKCQNIHYTGTPLSALSDYLNQNLDHTKDYIYVGNFWDSNYWIWKKSEIWRNPICEDTVRRRADADTDAFRSIIMLLSTRYIVEKRDFTSADLLEMGS